MTKCPVCKATMLRYVNPVRLLCPRAAQHYKYLGGNMLGRSGTKSRKKKK